MIKTEVGYSGGHAESPTYDEVCTDSTGHAEVVRVEFDPNRVSYDELLDVFWTNHDPSQLNRQVPTSARSTDPSSSFTMTSRRTWR